MADIAVIFHWSAEALSAMSVEDLAGWREEARKRSGAEE